ncbi:MAG: hypothetical protein ACI4WG_01320 [Erysipelotrichaceae bacterium]
MKARVGELKPVGYNVYKDSYNQTVFVDFFTKKQYLVQKQDEKRYYVFSQRLFMSVCVLIIISLGFGNYILGVAGGIVTYGFFELFYRIKFLPTLQELDLQLPARAKMIDGMRDPNKNSNASLIARAICGIVLVVLFLALIKMQYTNLGLGMNYYLLVAVSILLSIYAVYISYMCVVVLIERKGKRK